MTIDPGFISYFQGDFLNQLAHIFKITNQYALRLLYIFLILEIVVLGFMVALGGDFDSSWLFSKILLIGLVIFILKNYSYLLGTLLQSLLGIGTKAANGLEGLDLIENPVHIWKYGYDIGIRLLFLATKSSGIGLILIYLSLGFGIIITSGLLVIQITLILFGFYFLALSGLIILPLTVFYPMRSLLGAVLTGLLDFGLRIMVLLIILAIAIGIIDQYDFVTEGANLNQFFGLLFFFLAVFMMARYLPKAAGKLVSRTNLFSTIPQIGSNKNRSACQIGNFVPSQIGQTSVNQPSVGDLRAGTMVNQNQSLTTTQMTPASAGPLVSPLLTNRSTGGIKGGTDIDLKKTNEFLGRIDQQLRSNNQKHEREK